MTWKLLHNKHCTIIIFALLVLVCGSFKINPKPFGVKTIVIDAGHGGKDPGCSGVKYKEKDVALSVALKLGQLIEQNCKDVKVVYTRTTDVFVELQERAAIANRINADLFLCIHCNANPNKDAHGSETYVMGLHKTRGNLDVAKRENASILLEDNYKKNYEGFDPNSDEANIIFSMYQNKHLEQALNLSTKIQSEYKDKARRIDKGVKQAGFLVLWKTAMTSLLTETGFLTNPEEELFLGSDKGQEYLAVSIFKAFREYKDDLEGRKVKYDEAVDKIPAYEPPKDSTSPIVSNDSIPVKIPVKLPADTISSDVFFRVQLVSSDKRLSTNSDKFKGLESITEFMDRGRYKYLVGRSAILEESVRLQSDMRKRGFTDAFVVAFRGADRISMEEAKKLLKK